MKARNENGNIVVYSEQQMKQKFNRFQLANGSDVNLFYASAKEVLEEYGFFDYLPPVLLEGERYGEKYKDEVNNVFTCYVEQIPPKTQEELDAEAQTALDNDSSAQIIQNHINNGQTELRRIWDKIQRLKDNGQLTANQFRTVSEVLFDALIPLEFGMWQVAQTKINATPTASGIIGTIRTQVKAIIDDYVTANY